MTNEFLNMLDAGKELTEKEVELLAPLTLAYIGDAVYEVYVRTYLVNNHSNMNVHKLHVKSIHFVKANSQAKIIHFLDGKLSDEEADIVRRGRNAKSGTVPKNADINDYKYATGFEALIGYLYLKKRYDRLNEIFEICIKQSM